MLKYVTDGGEPSRNTNKKKRQERFCKQSINPIRITYNSFNVYMQTLNVELALSKQLAIILKSQSQAEEKRDSLDLSRFDF